MMPTWVAFVICLNCGWAPDKKDALEMLYYSLEDCRRSARGTAINLQLMSKGSEKWGWKCELLPPDQEPQEIK